MLSGRGAGRRSTHVTNINRCDVGDIRGGMRVAIVFEDVAPDVSYDGGAGMSAALTRMLTTHVAAWPGRRSLSTSHRPALEMTTDAWQVLRQAVADTVRTEAERAVRHYQRTVSLGKSNWQSYIMERISGYEAARPATQVGATSVRIWRRLPLLSANRGPNCSRPEPDGFARARSSTTRPRSPDIANFSPRSGMSACSRHSCPWSRLAAWRWTTRTCTTQRGSLLQASPKRSSRSTPFIDARISVAGRRRGRGQHARHLSVDGEDRYLTLGRAAHRGLNYALEGIRRTACATTVLG